MSCEIPIYFIGFLPSNKYCYPKSLFRTGKRCEPGRTYEVADTIYEREIVSEMYSTSGDFDLMLKLYVPEDQDVGKYVNDKLLDIAGIRRSLTTLTFKAF